MLCYHSVLAPLSLWQWKSNPSVCPSSTCNSAASCPGTSLHFTECAIHLGVRGLLCIGSSGIKPKLTLRRPFYLGKSHSKTDYTCRKGKRFRSSTYRLLHHTVPSWSSRRYLQTYLCWGWDVTDFVGDFDVLGSLLGSNAICFLLLKYCGLVGRVAFKEMSVTIIGEKYQKSVWFFTCNHFGRTWVWHSSPLFSFLSCSLHHACLTWVPLL